MMHVKKVLLFVLVISVIMVGIVGCSSNGKSDASNQKVIAEYKGGQVTEGEFNSYLGVLQFFNPQVKDTIANVDTKKKVLNEYIGDKYLFGQVQDESYKAEAKAMFDQIKQQKLKDLGSQQKYEDALSGLNIKETDIQDYLDKYYAIQSYFVQKKYAENKNDFTIVTVSHILIQISKDRTDEQAKKRAEEVLAKLKAGGDFAQLAKEYSDDPGSKNNGGTYKDYPAALFVKEFKDAAMTLPINTISGLVKTDFGYHIIKVLARSIPSIDKVPQQLKTNIFTQEYNNFMVSELPSIIIKTNL